jgi:hypothetical protein
MLDWGISMVKSRNGGFLAITASPMGLVHPPLKLANCEIYSKKYKEYKA